MPCSSGSRPEHMFGLRLIQMSSCSKTPRMYRATIFAGFHGPSATVNLGRNRRAGGCFSKTYSAAIHIRPAPNANEGRCCHQPSLRLRSLVLCHVFLRQHVIPPLRIQRYAGFRSEERTSRIGFLPKSRPIMACTRVAWLFQNPVQVIQSLRLALQVNPVSNIIEIP